MLSPSRPTQSSSSSTAGAGEGAWDELLDRQGNIRPLWRNLAEKMNGWGLEDRASISSSAERMLDDLGTTFNVYSDVGGAGQPYQIDPLPLLISPEEWQRVSTGLVQRMKLLEMVVADLYGPQKLLEQGLIPPDLIHANPAFHPQIRGTQPVGNRFLITTACDLIRSPEGQWTVLRDQTRGPGGLGQALENRKVTSNLLIDHYEKARVAQLGPFFDHERVTMQSLSPSSAEVANVVVLTPGFRHPSYFEHAYKARLLGFPLVEAADLTVRERRLFLKTLAGLRRIDTVACRIDDDAMDPLEFWTLGRGGVPGMVEAWRSGNVAIANAPGAGFAASSALMPFLPEICRKWLGEDLKLPFVETWWLGQPVVRKRVLENLSKYVLLPAFGGEPHLPLRCSSLSPSARRQWATAIEERPHEFVVQRDMAPSQAPSLESRTISSRPVVWRTFSLNTAAGPIVLPGGLAHVGKNAQPPQLWPVHSGFTKDVWVSEGPNFPVNPALLQKPSSSIRRHPAASEVPSRIAEQLYWVGRYAERVEIVTRLLRVTLRHMVGETGRRQKDQLDACLDLIRGSGLLPKAAKIRSLGLLATLTELVHDNRSRAGIATLTRNLLSNAAAARDRLSDDTWRFFNRLEDIVHPPSVDPRPTDLSRTLDTLVLHLAAFAGMQAENMTRGQGWRFLETGRRIERALGGLSLLHAASSHGDGESSVLEPLLETCDSVMTYRRRHFSRPRWDAVCGLIFFDATNPRSVAFQINILKCEATRFPGDPNFGLFPAITERLDALALRFHNPVPPDADELEKFGESLEELSDLLTQHYFSHSVRRVY
jgi:uncharacterized circularly permuted ATP-grasp superfamily protein/uncharacterized alpha-E superfamily protein